MDRSNLPPRHGAIPSRRTFPPGPPGEASQGEVRGDVQRILDEVLECLRTGERLNPRWYYVRFPHLEQELRGHFRRLGLVEDPFSNSAQFLREAPPWDRLPEAQAPPAPPAAAPPSPERSPAPGHDKERKLLLENLVRSGNRPPGGLLGRRARATAILVLTFAGGWAGLMLLTDLWSARSPSAQEAARIEGLASLSVLAAGFPAAKEDLLLEGIVEADRAARESRRWEIRWLRSLMLAELGKEQEAREYLESLPRRIREALAAPAAGESRSGAGPPTATEALAAVGEVVARKPERARARLGARSPGGAGVLGEIARGAAFPEERRQAAPDLLRSPHPHVRLLGIAWGVGAGLAPAREALGELPLTGPAEARMLVELGGEERFLERARPGRLDLAPLRIRVLRKRGDRAGALRLAEELIARAPDSFDLRMAAAVLLREEGDCERSREHLLAATLIRPDSPEPMREWFLLALGCRNGPELMGPCADLFLGRASAEARTRLADGVAAGRDQLSEKLLAGCGFGLPSEEEVRVRAVSLLKRAAAAGSGSPALAFLLGRTLFAQGLWGEAAREFSIAAEVADPRDEPIIRVWQAASDRRAGPAGGAAAPVESGPSVAARPAGGSTSAAIARIEIPAGDPARGRPEGAARPSSARVAAPLRDPDEGDLPAPEKVVESLAGRVDLEQTGLSTLEEYARGLEGSGAWPSAAVVRAGILLRDPRSPARRVQAAWAIALAGDPGGAEALLDASAPRWGDPARDESGEEALVRAFLSAAAGDLEAAVDWLGTAIRREPVDPRPWFLRGYFQRLAGSEHASRRDWNEVRTLVASPPPGLNPTANAAIPGLLLEPGALAWQLALLAAARGDTGGVRFYVNHGPSRARTLLGSFFRAAALAAAGDWTAAEAEALAYRSAGYPVQPWMALDPWAGALFEPGPAGAVPPR